MPPNTPSRLTPHERVIRQQLASGKTKADIARELGVPASTLKSFVQALEYGTSTASLPVRAAEPTDEVTREELLAAELAELRKHVNRGRKADVAQERIMRAIEEAVSRVMPDESIRLEAAPAPSDDAHHRQVLVLSDFHGGEVVDPDAVNGLNDYSWDIQEQRVDQVLAAVMSHRRTSPELTGLDILFVGDMCSGSNHQELAETNEFPLAEQGVKMGYLLGRIVEALVPHYPDIRCLGIVGNHPRLQSKPAAKRVHDNMDWVAYLVAMEYLRGYESVSFHAPTAGAAFWEVAGQTLYVWHGDGVRSSMPGVPWGGVSRRVNEIRRAHAPRRIDGFVLGHFHQANVMLDLGIFMNGSLKGVDEWCLKNFGGGAKPTQLLLTYDERRSRLTDVKLITPDAGLPGATE